MTGPRVDLPQFRLRAFETDWLRPLTQSGSSPINAVLVREAEAWVRVGQRLGFFAEDMAPDRPASDVAEVIGRYFDDVVNVSTSTTLHTFAQHLLEAQEDLTPERSEFLHIVLFESNAGWRRRLDEVHRFEEPLASGSRVQSVSERTVRSTRWCLGGAESDLTAVSGMPANWRAPDAAVLEAWSPGAAERLVEINRIRSRVSHTVQAIITEDIVSEVVTPNGTSVLVDQIQGEITTRQLELEPAVDEYRRLESALAALAAAEPAPRVRARRAVTQRKQTRPATSPTSARAAAMLAEVQALRSQRRGLTIPELAAKLGIRESYLYRVLPGREQKGTTTKRGRRQGIRR